MFPPPPPPSRTPTPSPRYAPPPLPSPSSSPTLPARPPRGTAGRAGQGRARQGGRNAYKSRRWRGPVHYRPPARPPAPTPQAHQLTSSPVLTSAATHQHSQVSAAQPRAAQRSGRGPGPARGGAGRSVLLQAARSGRTRPPDSARPTTRVLPPCEQLIKFSAD